MNFWSPDASEAALIWLNEIKDFIHHTFLTDAVILKASILTSSWRWIKTPLINFFSPKK